MTKIITNIFTSQDICDGIVYATQLYIQNVWKMFCLVLKRVKLFYLKVTLINSIMHAVILNLFTLILITKSCFANYYEFQKCNNRFAQISCQ